MTDDSREPTRLTLGVPMDENPSDSYWPEENTHCAQVSVACLRCGRAVGMSPSEAARGGFVCHFCVAQLYAEES